MVSILCEKCGETLIDIRKPKSILFIDKDKEITKCANCGSYYKWTIVATYIQG